MAAAVPATSSGSGAGGDGVSAVSAAQQVQIIEPDDLAFLEELVSANHQEIYWKGWVTLYTKSNAAAKKSRILAITNFRLITIKQGVFSRSARQSYPFLDLELMSSSDTNPNQLHMIFKGQELDIVSEAIVDIAQSILFGFKSITYGWPDAKCPQVDLPERFLKGFLPPSPDTQDGVLASYLATCDYVQVQPRLPIIDFFMTAFQSGDKELDLYECLHTLEKAAAGDVLCVSRALQFTNWFSEFVVADYPIRDEGVEHLAHLFTNSTQIRRFTMANVKATKVGITALSNSIARGMHGLSYINISKNPIGDSGVKTLVDALLQSKKVLHTLSVQQCGFSNKGFVSLFEALAHPDWAAKLAVLDVSDNHCGKSGTAQLCEWIRDVQGLKQLYLMRTGVDLDAFLPALAENAPLVTNGLTTLNLSGNKLTKVSLPVLCSLARMTHSLTHLHLVGSSVSHKAVVDLLASIIENDGSGNSSEGGSSGSSAAPLRFWVDLSGNDLGEKGGKGMAELFERHSAIQTIHTLVLNGNAIGAEGIAELCKALTGKAVHTLCIDNNIKSSMFSSKEEKEACDAIATFMNETPTLRELSVAGDDSHYLKAAAFPILEALSTNTSLQFLDLSRNRLGDEGASLFARALYKNKTLSSFTIERNRMTIQGLRDIRTAVLENKTLTDWKIPMHDIENTLRNANKQTIQELGAMILDFEQTMDRNYQQAELKRHEQRGSDDNNDDERKDDAKSATGSERRESFFNTKRGRKHSRAASTIFDTLSKEKMAMLNEEHDDVGSDGGDEHSRSKASSHGGG